MTKFEMSGERNLTMLTDLYQLTMANGYFECGMNMRRAAFDLFYRGGGGYPYAVAAVVSASMLPPTASNT